HGTNRSHILSAWAIDRLGADLAAAAAGARVVFYSARPAWAGAAGASGRAVLGDRRRAGWPAKLADPALDADLQARLAPLGICASAAGWCGRPYRAAGAVEVFAREPAPASPLRRMASAARNLFYRNGGDSRMKLKAVLHLLLC